MIYLKQKSNQVHSLLKPFKGPSYLIWPKAPCDQSVFYMSYRISVHSSYVIFSLGYLCVYPYLKIEFFCG